jgi:CubicO group peptidase (beta-lactamase class C family)
MSRVIAAALCVLFVPAPVHTQAPSSATATPVPVFSDRARREKLAGAFAAIREGMPEAVKQIGAPGLAWGVIIDGELAASGAVGLRDVEANQPATPQSIFRIASMTKSFTALAILSLRDDGKLSLDDAVTKHIPEFAGVALPTKDAPAITIRHLLTHSEGFPEDNPWGDRQLAIPDGTLGEWLKQGLPFSTSPGTAFEYSNYGFALLGRIVSNVSGVPFGDYIRTRILTPLGMRATLWETSTVPADRIAHGYRRDGERWIKETPLAHGSYGAMGGLYTSAEDLARYVAFMLSAWPPRDDAEAGPVRRSSVREMQQGQRHSGLAVFRTAPDAPLTVRTSAYAYGLGSSQDCRFRVTVAHGGGLPGYGSSMTWLPEHGVGVIVLANVTYAGAGGIARGMLEKLAATGGLQPRHWPASAPLLETRAAVSALVNQWSDEGLQAIAADNLLLDRPLDTRRQDVMALHESLGACAPEGDIEAENWLRGSFKLGCQRGWLQVAFTLAPTRPPRVQYLSLTEGRPLSERLSSTVRRLASATAGDTGDLTPLLASSVDAAALLRQLEALRDDYGTCAVGATLNGNGSTSARVRLTCERGQTDLVVRAASDGRLERVQFASTAGEPCVP